MSHDVEREEANQGLMAAWMELRHVHGWNYDVWTAARQRAREAERRDQLTLIVEEAGEAAERGLH